MFMHFFFSVEQVLKEVVVVRKTVNWWWHCRHDMNRVENNDNVADDSNSLVIAAIVEKKGHIFPTLEQQQYGLLMVETADGCIECDAM